MTTGQTLRRRGITLALAQAIVDKGGDGSGSDTLSAGQLAQVQALIAAGGADPTIHNWFPDGIVSSAALIDIDNTYPDTACWQTSTGTETLALAVGAGDPDGNAVSATLPGGVWNEGVSIADWQDEYGCGQIPAGTWQIGVSVKASVPLVLYMRPATSNGSQSVGSGPKAISTSYTRFVFTVTTTAAGPLGIEAFMRQADYVDGAVPPAVTFYFSKLMVTDGDPSVFADGGSDGWDWAGTPNASASLGPQPAAGTA